jgi:molybdopterin/thiamine biosynthesis adenylyltransferase
VNRNQSNLSGKCVAVIGVGCGGSVIAEESAKVGVGELILVDPDVFTEDNCKRHVLTRNDVGKNKALAMAEHLATVPGCRVCAQPNNFGERRYIPAVRWYMPGGCEWWGNQKADRFFHRTPDVICSCVDSLKCESLINEYALEHKIPTVFGGVHGDAHTVEVITVIPGETPCYDCYEREGPGPEPTQEKYTNPNYDSTKMPHQEGLWCDVLMGASIQFQAVLGVLGVRKKFAPLVLVSLRYPFTIEAYSQKTGCAICSDNMEGLTI